MNQSHSNIQTQCKIRKEKVNVKEMTTLPDPPPTEEENTFSSWKGWIVILVR